ncbi:MAG: hypothetical protein WCL44_10475 [bacterium]
MKASGRLVAALFLSLTTISQISLADPHRIGIGIQYLGDTKSIDTDFKPDGLSYLASYQFVSSDLFRLEADIEILPPGLTDGNIVYIPQVYAILGDTLYAGLGVGMVYDSDELTGNTSGNTGIQAGNQEVAEFKDGQHYNIRIGLDVPFSSIHIDINANYRFTKFDELSDFDGDRIQVGLLGRYEF